MTEFKVGDRVRLSAQASDYRRNGYYSHDEGVGDLHGTVTDYANGHPLVEWDGGRHGSYNNPPEFEIELVKPEYDQDTVNAIVKHLRDTLGYAGFAAEVEEAFAVPKTRTVTVNFQVPEGKSVVDYLENVGIDYDIEGGN